MGIIKDKTLKEYMTSTFNNYLRELKELEPADPLPMMEDAEYFFKKGYDAAKSGLNLHSITEILTGFTMSEILEAKEKHEREKGIQPKKLIIMPKHASVLYGSLKLYGMEIQIINNKEPFSSLIINKETAVLRQND
jgi:hypothetical protein